MVAGESAHRDDPDLGTECLGAFLQSRGHDIRGTSAFHIQQTGSTGPIDQWSQVEEDRREGVLTVSAHVFPAVLIDTQDTDPGQMRGIGVDGGSCGIELVLEDRAPTRGRTHW